MPYSVCINIIICTLLYLGKNLPDVHSEKLTVTSYQRYETQTRQHSAQCQLCVGAHVSNAKLPDVHLNTAVVFFPDRLFSFEVVLYSQNPPLTALLTHIQYIQCLARRLLFLLPQCSPNLSLLLWGIIKQQRKICLLSGAVCYLFSKRAASRPSHNLAGLRT